MLNFFKKEQLPHVTSPKSVETLEGEYQTLLKAAPVPVQEAISAMEAMEQNIKNHEQEMNAPYQNFTSDDYLAWFNKEDAEKAEVLKAVPALMDRQLELVQENEQVWDRVYKTINEQPIELQPKCNELLRLRRNIIDARKNVQQ